MIDSPAPLLDTKPLVSKPEHAPWWKPWGNRTHRGPSWGCRAVLTTSTKTHDCRGHANSRPEYMHRCVCGFRWAA